MCLPSQKILDLEKLIKEKQNIEKIYRYFNELEYVHVFATEIKALRTNLQSIEVLLEEHLFEDAMTIFRKYLETYLSLSSIVKHPELSGKYLLHNKLIGQKACGENLEDIKRIISNNPKGYLEYGYLASLGNVTNKYGNYTVRSVAKASELLNYYDWYRKSSNFVHNNLASTNYDIQSGKASLKSWINMSLDRLVKSIHKIIHA